MFPPPIKGPQLWWCASNEKNGMRMLGSLLFHSNPKSPADSFFFPPFLYHERVNCPTNIPACSKELEALRPSNSITKTRSVG